MKYFFSVLLLAGTGLAQTPPASVLFDKDAVHEIRLTFSQTDYWEQLTANYEENEDDVPYIEASLEWGEYRFASVGVRFKGNSSYNGATTRKKPFRIKLNEFVKGQKIDSMASFSLSNGWNDASFVREKAYYEMAAAAGMKAPRSGFAALYINGQYWGLYILTEVVNGDFLKAFFGKDDDGGNLYKADMGASFSYLGADPAAYKTYFEKQSNEEEDDWADLVELCRLIDQTPVEEYPARLAPLVDIDSVLTALALDNLTVNLDSYVGMGQNFYIYRRPSDKRWVWIPWDPSLAFGALSQGLSTQQMIELALEYVGGAAFGGGDGGGVPTPPGEGQPTPPGGGQPGPPGEGGGVAAPPADGGSSAGAARPLATKLWQVPAYKARYREIYARMVEKAFVPDTLLARMVKLREMIAPWVAKDTQKLVTQEQFEQAMTAESASPGGGYGQPADPGGAPEQPAEPPDGRDQDLGGRIMGAVPGLQPFVKGRHLAVTALLDGRTPLSVQATPASVALAQVAGAAGASQTVALALSDTAKSAPYRAASSAAWLSVNPASGTIPAALSIAAGGAGVAAGNYTGSVTLTTEGVTNTSLSIPVSLAVAASPSLVAAPAALTLGQSAGAAAAAAQTIQVVSTAGATAFSVGTASASCGSFFSVSPVSGTTPAAITVSASPTATGPCNGTITFSAPGMASAAVQVSLGAATVPSAPAPSITAVVNAASYAAGAVAPGEIVTLFGNGFGVPGLVMGSVADGRLATSLNGIQVTFDGVPAPILYAGGSQMSVIVPFEVAGRQETNIQVSAGPRQQNPAAVKQAVAAAAPGIFTLDASGGGPAAAPVAKGSTVSIYLTGAGQLDPAASTGAVASGSPLRRVAAEVTATIGGQPATVLYAGEAPGSVYGLYQVNLQVPASVASGSVPVRIAASGATSQAQATVTIQ